MSYPNELKYTKDHEWAKVEGKLATVGITQFAVEQLGDVTLVELPKVGTAVKQGEVLGNIESVKTVSELFAPLSGTVKEVNTALADAPQAVNEEPYGKGWMVRIELGVPGEVAALLDAAAYEKHVASEG
ncbi:MAG: glycine cleavage system protein GcvH [Deltaproteobacteria bacterium]|nr:glycine cleavage system protein GcvH [Deltaproteobacteria bacterium]